MTRLYEFDDFIKYVYGKEGSSATCVVGPNGSGKTEFNVLQLERIHALGLGARFGSNMPYPEHIRPSFEMDFVEDLETLEKLCRLLNPNPEKHGMKKYFFFLSELGKFVPRDEAWKPENREFIQKLQTVRKFGLCILSDAIDRVDARILSARFFNGIFTKPFSDNPKFAIYDDFRTGRKITFKEIPRCKSWFNTFYSAEFYLKPQDETSGISLDQTEEIVKLYMETGSWKKAGVTTQQGKRELIKVLRRYFAIREPVNHEESEEKPTSVVATAD